MYAMYGQSIKNFVFDALPSKKAIDHRSFDFGVMHQSPPAIDRLPSVIYYITEGNALPYIAYITFG